MGAADALQLVSWAALRLTPPRQPPALLTLEEL